MHTFTNFNSIDVDTTFQMKNENNSLLWMDLATAFEQQTVENMRLKRKVAIHKKTMKEEGKKHKKFGATAKRLGVNDAVPLTNYSDNIFYGNLYLGSENEPIATIFDTSYD